MGPVPLNTIGGCMSNVSVCAMISTLYVITKDIVMTASTTAMNIVTTFVPTVTVDNTGVTVMHDVIAKLAHATAGTVWAPTEESKEFSKNFFRMMKDKMKTDNDDIALDKIELFSAKSIATQFCYALEKAKFYTQYLPMMDDKPASAYVFLCEDKNFDNRRPALWATQVARILPWLHTPYNFRMVCQVSQFHENIKNIERANKHIFNDYVGDVVAKDRGIWETKLTNLLNLCVLAGLCEFVEVDGIKCIKTTQKYNNTCVDSRALMHSTERFHEFNRTRSMIKGLQGKREKQALSKHVKDAIQFIQDQPQMVNRDLFDAVIAFHDALLAEGVPEEHMPQFLKDQSHVLTGCAVLRDYDALYAQYFMDNRGRQYQSQHCGPNPQAADLSKALCFHTVENIVFAGSDEHAIFLKEMEEEVVDGAGDKWMTEEVIRFIAKNPARSLMHGYKQTQALILAAAQANGTTYEQEAEFHNYGLPFKKFFTYMTMCQYWVQFRDNGSADVRLGFGPDCKSSGAQILGIMACAKEAVEACGMITGFGSNKPKDLYQVSADMVNRNIADHKELSTYQIAKMTRNGIKRAFMAIQYGGGVPAITSGQDLRTYARMGVKPEDFHAYAELIIESIKQAMGPMIEAFIEGLRNAVAAHCAALSEKAGKPVYSFEYYHIDGFKVTKKGEADVQMTEHPFIISLGDTKKAGVIFGTMGEDEKGWSIPSNTQGQLQLQNFIHFFPVHFVQGLDAVMSRKIALESEKQGLRGYTCIHDQFRSCLEDSKMLRESIIPAVYEDMFIKHNVVGYLANQIGEINWGNPLEAKVNPVTTDILYSTDAYYFG